MEKEEKNVNIYGQIIQAFIEKIRPPQEVRAKLDIGYSFDKQVLEIFEIRPKWQNESEKIQIPVAKVRFIKKTRTWKTYWMRASGKWESYEPLPAEGDLATVLEEIENDPFGCFWG